MVNKRNINRVIASIKGEVKMTEQLGFNMGGYVEADEPDMTVRHCGTVACIAGHAHILKTKEDFVKMGASGEWEGDRIEDRAREYLGINQYLSNPLFYGYGAEAETMSGITPEQAIRTLEHLRDTGEVDWTV